MPAKTRVFKTNLNAPLVTSEIVTEAEVFTQKQNFRFNRGVIEAVPPLMRTGANDTGQKITTYNAFGTGTPLADGQVSLLVPWQDDKFFAVVGKLALLISGKALSNASTRVPIVHNLTRPQNSQEEFNYANLVWDGNDALFTTFEIEIVSTNEFRWRKDGGGWSSAITIQRSQAVDTNYMLYFLKTEGFTTSDSWTWAQGDFAASLPVTQGCSFVQSSGGLIFGQSPNLYRFNGTYVQQVGADDEVQGEFVEIYFGHLFVANGTRAMISGETERSFTIQNSDLNDLDAFGFRIVNEADAYEIETSGRRAPARAITGMRRMNELLVVYTAESVWTGRYVGFPQIMQWEEVFQGVGCVFSHAVVHGDSKHYFPGEGGFYSFDGVNPPQKFGLEVWDSFQAEVKRASGQKFAEDFVRGYWDHHRQEVVWLYRNEQSQHRMLVYQTRTNNWYTRTLPSSVDSAGASYTNIGVCVNSIQDPERFLFGGGQTLYLEATGEYIATRPGNDVTTRVEERTLISDLLVSGQEWKLRFAPMAFQDYLTVKELRGMLFEFSGASCLMFVSLTAQMALSAWSSEIITPGEGKTVTTQLHKLTFTTPQKPVAQDGNRFFVAEDLAGLYLAFGVSMTWRELNASIGAYKYILFPLPRIVQAGLIVAANQDTDK